MPTPNSTPEYAVSDACIAFTEAIITYRHSLMSVDEAQEAGEDLFTWFKENGGLTSERAAFAARSTALGTVAISKTTSQSADDVIQMIKDTYEHYTGTA